MLDVHGAVFHLDCFLDGNNVHADACASRRNHRRDHSQRQIGHALEEHCKFGMFVKLLLYHVCELGRAGHEHGKHIATFLFCAGDRPVVVVVVAVVVLQNADVAHLVKKFLQLLGTQLGIHLFEILERVVLAHLHFESNIRHFVGDNATKSPVFWVVCRHAFDLVVDAVRDFSC